MNRPITNHRSAFFLLVSTVWIAVGCHSESINPIEVGDQAPPFDLVDVTAQRNFQSDSLKGDIVVLNFWSTSCPVCMKEIEELKEIHHAGRAKVVSIAIDDNAERISKVAKAKKIDYPVLSGNARIFTQYDGFSTPYSLILDRQSVIRKKYFGPINKAEFNQLLNDI